MHESYRSDPISLSLFGMSVMRSFCFEVIENKQTSSSRKNIVDSTITTAITTMGKFERFVCPFNDVICDPYDSSKINPLDLFIMI